MRLSHEAGDTMSKEVPAGGEQAERAPEVKAAYGAAAMADLEEHIDWGSSECLNADSKCPFANVLKQGLRDQPALTLASDADEQLLLSVGFKTRVKVYSVLFDGPAERAPKKVKLLVNKSKSLGFDDADQLPGDQEFELACEELGAPYNLKFVKFQSVERLSIFIASNQSDDDDATVLSQLKLVGCPLHTTNMADFKRVSGEKGEAD